MVLLKSFQSLDQLPDMSLHHLVGLCEALFQTDHPLTQVQLVFPSMAAVNAFLSPYFQLRRRMHGPVTLQNVCLPPRHPARCYYEKVIDVAAVNSFWVFCVFCVQTTIKIGLFSAMCNKVQCKKAPSYFEMNVYLSAIFFIQRRASCRKTLLSFHARHN